MARDGQTIAEIIADVCPYDVDQIGAVVFIEGEIIPPECWARVRPKGGTLTNIRIVPQGGGGGGKNPLTSLLSIAVMIAAPYAGAFLAQSAFGAGLIGSVGGIISATPYLSAAVGILGKLAMTALIPPPKQSGNTSAGRLSNPDESPTQFIEGARNSLDPFGVVPIILGTNRMFPIQAARPFTETAGADQYVRQLFTYGWGQKIQISEIKIGETNITDFDGVQMEHRLAGDLHQTTALFSNDVFQDDYSVLLNQVDGFTTRTTQKDVDEVTIDITFTGGLCEFSADGRRLPFSVDIEAQFALAGSPQVWSTSSSAYTSYSGTTVTLPDIETTFDGAGFRRDVIYVDQFTGAIAAVVGTSTASSELAAVADALPSSAIRLATIVRKGTRPDAVSAIAQSVVFFSDDRQPSDYGARLQNSGSFAPSQSGLDVSVAAGAIKLGNLFVTGSQTEPLRASLNMAFPARGTYDIRVRRLTGDNDSDQILDRATLTAIKSITHTAPVNLEGINGTALRMKGTDQLNGAVDQFNVVASNVILDYRADTDEWVENVTSNPASIYRYVLQGAANAKPVADAKINIADLEQWHIECTARGLTYNRVIDYESTVDEILRDVAAAGAASPAIVDGKRTVVVDKIKDDVVQIVTPRNSWDYSGQMAYPDLPHAFRVEFRNAEKGYQTDERIVYADGYTESNATIFERLEYSSCTSAALAWKHGRRYLATLQLRPELHTFMMDVENLVFTRGDRIKFEHDVPIVGVGDGRIKTFALDGLSFTIDDTITMASGTDYYVRIRKADGTQIYKQVRTVAGDNASFTFFTAVAVPDQPTEGDLCYFVEAGGELDLIVTKIEPQGDLSARITCVDYAPAIFTAESGTIPPFVSVLGLPVELRRPDAPELVDIQSDENAMLLNSDGSYVPRIVIALRNTNESDVIPVVQYRQTGTSSFLPANALQLSPTLLALSGFDDGQNYDIHIRYKRPGGTGTISLPLQINNYRFIGATGNPEDVTGFAINVVGDTAILKWAQNTDIDLSHYHIKFARAFTGATWQTAQTLDDNVIGTQFSAAFLPGTYLIKAVDRLGNESETAAAVITFDPGVLRNVVETLDQTATSPLFAGTKDNVQLSGSSIILGDVDADGYYYFDRTIDLGDVFSSYLSASITAGGDYTNDIFDITDIFAEADIFSGGSNNVFTIADIFAEADIFGIGTDSWLVELQFRTTPDSTAGSPVTWTAWKPLVAGVHLFRGVQFRLLMRSLSAAAGITPRVTGLSVTIDMPDRIERHDDQAVSAGGVTITYSTPFAVNPAVAILLQDADSQDEIQFTAKTASGFTFKVYNAGTAGFVARTFDSISSGYGRG
jgi:hypothetical protein